MKLMKKSLFFFILFAAIASFAADPFDLPEKTTVISRDESGKTWAFNGMLDSSLSATKKLLKESILKKGFQFQHEIPVDEKGEKQVILSFVKNKETLIVMLWSENGKKTYFSYGITK